MKKIRIYTAECIILCAVLFLNFGCNSGPQRLEKVGLQLYTLGTEIEDIEVTLVQVKEAGYDQVEFPGTYYNKTPTEMKEILVRTGLTSPANHARNLTSEEGLAQSINDALIVGHKYLVMPTLPGLDYSPMGESSQGQQEQTTITMEAAEDYVNTLNQIGQACREARLDFLFHNHQAEFVKIEDGELLYDYLLQQTDPELVNFEIDLGWAIAAGADPVAYFEKYPGRFPLFHVKDITNDEQACVVGEGIIDFAPIFAKSKLAGVKCYIVEQDMAPDPIANVTASVQYLKKMKF
ncbi:sugar phosphate isomerase/epimerase family protein [Planctomycetota bacterium]